MNRDKNWQRLEDSVSEYIKPLDKYARPTKGSGNKNEKGDVKNSCGLNIECKCYQKINVWESKWLTKCEGEIPLHSKKIAIVVTENNKKEKHVHLSADDFFNLYIEYWRLKNGG